MTKGIHFKPDTGQAQTGHPSQPAEYTSSEKSYRAVFEEAGDGMFIADSTGLRGADVNRRGCELLCYTRDKFLRLTTADLVPGVDIILLPVHFEAEALQLCSRHLLDIDLVVTDVVMPGMNGHELAERIRALKPDIKMIFVSSYTANTVAQRGIVEEGFNFVPKPYTPRTLPAKIRSDGSAAHDAEAAA